MAEFFERGPPSIVDSIIYSFLSRNSAVDQLPAVRHLQYTGIFPFVNHVSELYPILDHLEEFDIRLAPDVDSGILDDRERVGRAELQDCWQELHGAYFFLSDCLASPQRPSRIRKFICGDVRIANLSDELDELFTPLCLPQWVEIRPGVFHRLQSDGSYG
jgi:hypothetical protein